MKSLFDREKKIAALSPMAVNNDSQPKKYITEEKKIPPYLVSLLIMAE
jgi:hypothetical protein